jgi:hypothetical protein
MGLINQVKSVVTKDDTRLTKIEGDRDNKENKVKELIDQDRDHF